MSWYKQAKQSAIPKFDTPEDLLEWMEENVEYGWMDSEYQEGGDSDDEFWDNYSMLLPEEVAKHGIGTCWDQTIFEKYVFDHQFKYASKIIFIQLYGSNTHTFLLFRDDGLDGLDNNPLWYHFENADASNRGIHGPYETAEDAVDAVYEHLKSKKNEEYAWQEMDPENYDKKLTCKEFMDLGGYDYEAMDEVDRK